MTAWLVPSVDFAAKAGRPNSRGRLRFYASMKAASRDRWRDYWLEPAEWRLACSRALASLDPPELPDLAGARSERRPRTVELAYTCDPVPRLACRVPFSAPFPRGRARSRAARGSWPGCVAGPGGDIVAAVGVGELPILGGGDYGRSRCGPPRGSSVTSRRASNARSGSVGWSVAAEKAVPRSSLVGEGRRGERAGQRSVECMGRTGRSALNQRAAGRSVHCQILDRIS